MTFAIEMVAGERAGDRMVRCMRALLANGPLSYETTPAALSAFVDLPTDPVGYSADKKIRFSTIAPWRTNCAVTVRAAQGHCGRAMKPAVNAQSIEQYIEAQKHDANWVANVGTATPQPGDFFYVDPSARLGFDHVGIFGPETAPGVYETYEGGGGSGTRIGQSSRHLAGGDSYGRKIAGWWKSDNLLPASPDAFAETTGDVDLTPATGAA